MVRLFSVWKVEKESARYAKVPQECVVYGRITAEHLW
jgi:hypothetical protein